MTREEILKDQWVIDHYGDIHHPNYLNPDFEAGVDYGEEKMVEKAEKWLENFLEKTIQKPSINNGYTSDTIDLAESKRHRLIKEVLYDFKKAMEL